MVLAGLFAMALAAATWFAARWLLLKCALRRVDRELGEIVENLEDNRIVKLPHPDADLEVLLGTVNRALAGIREQSVVYARREAQLKSQVEHMSHDLRTPLTSMVGYLALIDEGPLDEEARTSLRIVRRKADALQRLIAQFYELAQARDEAVRLESSVVDAGRMLREAAAGRYQLLSERGLDVRLAVPERPIWVRANGPALERVVENLLDNMGKYAATTCEIEATPDAEGHVRLVFSNDVRESANIEVDRLFEPFYTADAARSSESSGLGLAIAHSLVERMGGALNAQLDEREGTPWLHFQVELEGATQAFIERPNTPLFLLL